MNISFSGINLPKIQAIKNISGSKFVSFKGMDNDTFTTQSTPYTIKDNLSKEELSAEIKDLQKQVSILNKKIVPREKREQKYELTKAHQEELDNLRSQRIFCTQSIAYYEALKKTPSLAFLRDPRLSYADRKELRNQDFVEDTWETSNAIKEIPGFEQTTIAVNSLMFNKAFGSIPSDYNCYYVDNSLPEYQENMDILKSYEGKELYNCTYLYKYLSQFNMNKEAIKRYIRQDKFEQIDLISHETGNLDYHTGIVDINSPKTIKAIEDYQSISPKPFETKDPKHVNIHQLISMGYGDSPKELYTLVKNGKLAGDIKTVEKDGKKIYKVFVDITATKNICKLIDLKKKNTNILSLKKVTKEYNLTEEDIENALLNGELTSVKNYLKGGKNTFYREEDSDICIDITDPKNIEFLSQYLPEEEENNSKKYNTNSIRMKIAWILAGDLKTQLRKLAAQNPEYKALKEKQNKVQELKKQLDELLALSDEENKESTVDEDDLSTEIGVLEEQIKAISLTADEEKVIKSFYKQFWTIPESKETFSKAMKDASAIISLYKEKGIDAIESPEIRELLED